VFGNDKLRTGRPFDGRPEDPIGEKTGAFGPAQPEANAPTPGAALQIAVTIEKQEGLTALAALLPAPAGVVCET
jgi:hypothetical protein